MRGLKPQLPKSFQSCGASALISNGRCIQKPEFRIGLEKGEMRRGGCVCVWGDIIRWTGGGIREGEREGSALAHCTML